MFSQPTYRDLCFDPLGRCHLVAGVGNALTILETVAAQAQSAGAPATLLYDPDDLATLTAPLQSFLSEANMGLRVYLAGPEAFLSMALQTAAPFGFGTGEIQAQRTQETGRVVFCVHCKQINRGVARALHQCEGCGVTLGVRDHFSRRLGCYMGVSA